MADAETRSHDLQSLLSSAERDFLIRNNGQQVKISELKGKTVGLYFSASWCGPCRRFTPKLTEIYKEFTAKDDFEVVFFSADRDEDSFNGYFSKMPWLAIPYSDSETLKRLDELFEVNGIPHLVILDENGKVLTEEGVGIIQEYGAEAYPFIKERISVLKEEEERARREQTLKSILVSPSRDFLVSKGGSQVPVAELEGEMVGLCFSLAGHGPCIEFAKRLVEVQCKLKEMGESFKVVLIPLDDDEDSFRQTLEETQWLALPLNDALCSKLVRYFELSALPTLVIIGPDGKTRHTNVAELVEEHGAEAYPFTPEKIAELEEIAKKKKESQTLESILILGDRDFVIQKDGSRVQVSELVGKNILLYFSAHWCPPCRAFLPKLIQAYHDIKAKDEKFEVIFISSDRDKESFNDFFSGMPWLALPFGDVRKKFLSRAFKVSGIPTVIAIGSNGRTVTDEARNLLMAHGASAYPFTPERLAEMEKEIEERAKGWPEKVNSALHEQHELTLTRRRTYVCDGCEEEGNDWSFYCGECDFDLHPSAAPATPTSLTDPMLFPSYAPPTSSWGPNHRRSFSFTDACLGSSDASGSGLGGWKPCLYYARGYCKNGASCKFLHGLPDSPDSGSMVGSPAKLDVMEQCQELLLRSKTQQQQQQQQQHQRLNPASQIFSPAAASLPYATASTKCINFLLQQHQYEAQQRASAAASLMLGEDMHKFSRSRIEKNELLNNGAMLSNAGSRQIYLTFPADSTFREEDVSNYFSIYGPVQDVRIPFQQKRMFGFVTFVYPETVKLILAKGNPHFVCDARVLVKPYKEKGKVPDKKQQQQQVERGELSSPCGTPTGLDSRDPYDLQHGMQSSPRLLYNTQDLLWRRKLEEQAELQQAMELQSRRLMGLQLLDLSSNDNHIPHRRNLSIGTAPPVFSPTHSHHHVFINQPDRSSPKSPEESCLSPAMPKSPAAAFSDQNLKLHSELSGDINGKEEASKHDGCNSQDSLEHNLPDSPFASPTKCNGDASSFFSPAASSEFEEATHTINGAVVTYAPSSFSPGDNNLIAASSLLPATSTLEMASYNSCLFQMPRFFSGHGAIQM